MASNPAGASRLQSNALVGRVAELGSLAQWLPVFMNNWFFCMSLSVLTTTASAADYQQLPVHGGGAGSIGWIQTVADDFQFSSLTPIGSLTWWGGYFNPPTSADNFSL